LAINNIKKSLLSIAIYNNNNAYNLMDVIILDHIGGSSKVNKRVLDDDVANGMIVSYTQCPDGSFDALKLDMIKTASKKASV